MVLQEYLAVVWLPYIQNIIRAVWLTCEIGKKERKKKSEAAWKAEEDEELSKSRAFVELTEYIANAVENDTHFFVLAKLHKLYSLHTKAHTLQPH